MRESAESRSAAVRAVLLRFYPHQYVGPIAYCRHAEEQYSSSGAILAIFHFRSNIQQNHADFVSSIAILYYCSMILNAISCLHGKDPLAGWVEPELVPLELVAAFGYCRKGVKKVSVEVSVIFQA